MYKQVQIVVENEFIISYEENSGPIPTVFNRAFRKLTQEDSDVGKLFPIFIKVEDKYYTLGIFALNRLGSTSLFLELPEGTFFDHITFGKDLPQNKTHLTEIINGKRKKVTPLEPALLSNGTYHVLTLLINDISLLELAPKEITYPPIDIKHIDLVKEAVSTRGGYNGSGICEVMGKEGVIVFQLFLIPKGIDVDSLDATKFGRALSNDFFDEKDFKNITRHKAHLGHEFQNEYQFGLVSYRYNKKIKGPLLLEYSTPKNGMYFNSEDIELKQSIIKATRDESN